MAEYLDKTHLQYYTTKLVDKLKTIFVPSTRKVNGKALSSDVTLGAADILSSGQQNAVNSGVTSSDVTKLSGIESGAEVNVQANWNESDTTSDAYIQNKPTIPAAQVQSNWTEADNTSPAYIQNKPTIPAAQVQSNWSEADTTAPSFIQNKPTIPAAQVQSNWTEADTTDPSYIQNKPTIPPEMTILSYGHSTWADFIACYNTKTVVYCRASSNSNPGTGSQNRLAFMAYVNNDSAPTEVEFQYYRSVATHSDSQQGDQVYVYKLNKNNGWSVTVRSAFTKIVAGSGLTSSYNNGVLTISLS